jgi:hypothetical protein
VKRLRLKPEQYANSAELRKWCLRNMWSRYVPEELLAPLLHECTEQRAAIGKKAAAARWAKRKG